MLAFAVTATFQAREIRSQAPPAAVSQGEAAPNPRDWLELHNTHTGETLTVTFRNEKGEFVPEALAKLDAILADHRSHEQHQMDPQLFALLADLAAAAGAEPRYEIISGFRSSATN